MSGWRVAWSGFDPAKETLREALATLGNGVFASRGAAEEVIDGDPDCHYPGTYLAGGFNRAVSQVADRDIENEDLVNLPNWLWLRWRVPGGDWIGPGDAEPGSYEQWLDLRDGLLHRRYRVPMPGGGAIRLHARRFVHMGRNDLAGISWSLSAEGYSGRIEIESGLNGAVRNRGVARYRKLESRHLADAVTDRPEAGIQRLVTETRQSRLRIALAARLRCADHAEAPMPADVGSDRIADRVMLNLRDGETARIEKLVALVTSRHPAISAPELDALERICAAPELPALEAEHRAAWHALWDGSDIDLGEEPGDGLAEVQCILRFHLFHLLQTASPNSVDFDAGVPARGLHGEAYRGHIFWDELFILPSLTLRAPQISRALLRYRHRRLPAARALAHAEGLPGALFPWQSGSNGREETQQIHLNPKSGRWLPDNSHLQRHVNLAIAFNVWRYVEATDDIEFLDAFGAELILDIAQMMAGLTRWDVATGRYRIQGVMGPDEYHDAYPDANHPGIDDNAYTNVLTAWLLDLAPRVRDRMAPDRRAALCHRIGLAEETLARWADIAAAMTLPMHEAPEGGTVISQFAGYDALEELDWQGYRARYDKIGRMDRILEAEGDTPNRYKLSKQADALMLFFLFSREELERLFGVMNLPFDPDIIPRTIRYYLDRTSHGSTLSYIVHARVLSRLDRERSWSLFREALSSDIADIQGGTTHEGVHLGAMAGTVDIVQRAYSGMEVRDGVLWLDPELPVELPCLRMPVRFRGHGLRVVITDSAIEIASVEADRSAVSIGYDGQTYRLGAGDSLTLHRSARHAQGA